MNFFCPNFDSDVIFPRALSRCAYVSRKRRAAATRSCSKCAVAARATAASNLAVCRRRFVSELCGLEYGIICENIDEKQLRTE
jgi:hypothetical protein